MSGRALVTGATGMLGSYVVEGLLRRGWSVRALVRDPKGARWLTESGVELRLGSLEDRISLGAAAERCDAVFHAAAAIGAGGSWEAFREANVGGTANVVAAAAAAGARLVHVSSTAVYGQDRYRDVPTDEDAPLPKLPAHDVYGRSKQEAEAVVFSAQRAGRIWATAVRPPVMYGRRDRQFVPRVGPVFLRGVFPLIAGGRSTMTMVHAGNVAEGAILALEHDGADGRRYLLTDDHPLSVADLVRYAGKGLERRIRAIPLPLTVGRLGFTGLALALHAIGRSDLARHAAGTLAMLTRDNPFTTARARGELGWTPSVRPAEGLVEAFRWWRDRRRSRAEEEE